MFICSQSKINKRSQKNLACRVIELTCLFLLGSLNTRAQLLFIFRRTLSCLLLLLFGWFWFHGIVLLWVLLFSELYLSVFRDYSWICARETCRAKETMHNAGSEPQVSHVQGACPAWFTKAPAPFRYLLVPWHMAPSTPLLFVMNSCFSAWLQIAVNLGEAYCLDLTPAILN